MVENPVVGKVAFDGAKDLDEKMVKAAADLKPKEPWTRAKGEAALQRIRTLYRTKGHEDASIELTTGERPDGHVDVTFKIDETAIVKVERIGFTGNRAFTEAQLRDVVTTRTAGWFDFLKSVTAPVAARLDYDRAMLMRHYHKHGYADVQVAAAETARDPQTKAWRITFAIDEGERYAVGTITLQSSIPGVTAEGLRRPMTLAAGQTWNPESVETAIERMTEALVDAGHPAVEVLAKPSRDPGARVIGLDFRIGQGQRLVIERVDITGNQWTRDHVIRRELPFAEGDIFQPLLVERARKRLNALGLFKSVEIKREKGSDKDHVVLGVAVVEQDSREIGFGVGYSSSLGVIGDVTLTERNLFGQGQTLKLKLAVAQKGSEALLGFTEPRLLGSRLSGGFDLFYKDTDLTQSSSFKSTRYGGDIRVGSEIAPNTTATVNYTLARNTIHDIGANASAAIQQAAGSYDTSSIGYSVAYDTRNSKTNPASGVLISTSQDLAGLGGDVRYLRTTADIRAYLPVTDKITLATRASGGTISGWGGSDVRLLDMFYRGGETVRGFATGGIGPRDVLSPNQDAIGGANYMATTAELRFPMPFAPEEIGLRGAVFADAGSLWGASKATKSVPGVVGTTAALRASVGTGLIWDSPLGPLRVDYAVPIVKQPFDKVQNLRFGLVPGF